jgi:hypothetical protein
MRRASSPSRSLLPRTMARRQPALLDVARGHSLRASSAPPTAPRKYSLPPAPSSATRPSFLEPHRYQTDPFPSPRGDGRSTTSLDLMNSLQRSEGAVVKTRSGSVLSRGFILKTDHYPSGAPIQSCMSLYLLITARQVVPLTSTSMCTAPPTFVLLV